MFIYIFVGVFGQLAILGRGNPIKPQTIMDYYPSDDIAVLIVSLLFAVFLFCILPLIAMIARN